MKPRYLVRLMPTGRRSDLSWVKSLERALNYNGSEGYRVIHVAPDFYVMEKLTEEKKNNV